jgi:5-methylcytosine-specific restriction enzyme subunit McrC
MGIPKYLGIDQNFTASYYIGASWLIKNELAVVVTPKMEKIDFVQMFLTALRMEEKHKKDYFSKCYDICLDEPQIVATTQLSQLTPMLVLHYISLLYRLAQRGLKKNYVIQEENLKSKVKGRIMMGRHLQKNVFMQRADRVFCQFQEYTDDTPENRLLKRALLFADKFVIGSMCQKLSATDIPYRLSWLKTQFSHISDDIEPYQIQHLATNKLYKDYRDAIRVAKMLLRRFDYSIAKVDDDNHSTPPFWIDMSRLYEMWVWSKLDAAYPEQIEFQVKGHCKSQVDYIKKSTNEKLIMDAKYKPHYEDSNRGILDDIREISGYARDRKIVKRLGANDDEVKCVIIYPQREILRQEENDDPIDDCKETANFENGDLLPQCSEISWFRNFYKISVPLPT